MTISMTATPRDRKVIVGVDTHKHVHVAVAIDTWGVRLENRSFAVDSGGHTQLIAWAEGLGRIEAFGIEGTGSYGVGLASVARRAGHRVIEVNRADRRNRRANGKSDTVDAESAARSVLSGQSKAVPKTADGHVERAQRTHTEEFHEVRELPWTVGKLSQHCLDWEKVY
ncbi:MAG: transposase, partial [Candidatus Binatia bacterium]